MQADAENTSRGPQCVPPETALFRRSPRECNPLPSRIKAWLAIALAWAAAFVDAVGWLVLFHVYTAHMSGNTVSIGIEVAQRHWSTAFHHAWPLIPFLLGLMFSAATTAAARRVHWHSSFSMALVTELLALGSFIWLGERYSVNGELRPPSALMFYLLVSLPAAAMGLQTVTVTRISGLRVYTTYVTGSLAKFAEAVVHYAFWFRDRIRGRFRKRLWKVLRVTVHQRSAQHAALTGALWGAYVVGALCGVLLQTHYGLYTLLLPCAVLAVATAIDLVRPVAAADEPGPWDDS